MSELKEQEYLKGKFMECVRVVFVVCYVEKPIRGQAILDPVSCNEKRVNFDLVLKGPSWNCDHYLIKFYIKVI